jgi:DNA ligase 1
MKREFLMLAHTFKGDEPVGGWYWSEKLDGCRAFWDGGVTRGRPCADVPFANTAKDARYIAAPRSTGLWSRYGKSIQAPDWWLNNLPPYPLDGELYMGRGQFQQLISTIKTIEPGAGWRGVRYKVFDSPPLRVIFANGEVDNANFKKTFTDVIAKLGAAVAATKPDWHFDGAYRWLLAQGDANDYYHIHEQHALPTRTSEAVALIKSELEAIARQQGEGIILRNPVSFWAPVRARTLLKVKAEQDAEAEVVGYVWGRETDRGSKLLGLMGALVLNFRGKRLELSGFTDAERAMCSREGADHGHDRAAAEGYLHPGEQVSKAIHNPMFPIGSRVTFKYRELTLDGIPKEARYWRQHGLA